MSSNLGAWVRETREMAEEAAVKAGVDTRALYDAVIKAYAELTTTPLREIDRDKLIGECIAKLKATPHV